MAAGTVSVTSQNEVDVPQRKCSKLTLTWVSSAAGAVSGSPTWKVRGILSRVAFVPGTDSLQPSNAYDVTVLDSNGIDILAGQGANLSNTTPSQIAPGLPLKDGTTTSVAPVALDDVLELRVANAGDSKSGTVSLYLL